MPPRKIPKAGVPDKQAAVRVGQFDRAMEQFETEIGLKVLGQIEKYDTEIVMPMRLRITALETPWWTRLWRWATTYRK